MPHSATTGHTSSQSHRFDLGVEEHAVLLTDVPLTSQEIKVALSVIPSGSVTARTAGALRVAGPRRTIAEERAAFERAVAIENAKSTEG